MAKVLGFRPFKIPAFESGFFTPDIEKLKRFAEEDLARSGLNFDESLFYVTPGTRVPEGAEANYTIPYWAVDGTCLTDTEGYPVMYRTRMKFPEFSREQRYTQPSAEQLAKWGLPPFIPYIPPAIHKMEGKELICAEGEKKTLAIIKYLGLPSFGIGGCQLWRNPDGSGGIHPWIRELIRKRSVDTITIVPDGDIRRYDIATAYGNFARALENEGLRVKILDPGGKIDDLLVGWGQQAHQRWSEIQPLGAEHFVQSPAALIKEYGLAFKSTSQGMPIVHQHTSNVLRLMEEHPAFPKIWRNEDNNRIYVDEELAQPDLTEIEILKYFQHNLGFDKVTKRMIMDAMQALARQNSRRPFLEHIQKQIWDGTPRLETWMRDYWGVEDTPYVREVSSKFLMSSCARMHKPGTKVDWMLIVIGPQKTGKTTMPSILWNGRNLTLYGEHNDKDLHMLLHSALCVGFDELDSFSRREASNLKAMVTRNEDTFRPPYGATIEVFPRRFTLYGCGNRHDFLQSDPSGYRRYAVVEVENLLNFAGLEAARDQLWAEAWHLYQKGNSKFWEVEGASEHAEEYVAPNVLEDDILNWIESQKINKSAASIRDNYLYFSMSHLLAGIGMDKMKTNSGLTRDVSAILRKHGIEYRKSARPPWSTSPTRCYVAHI